MVGNLCLLVVKARLLFLERLEQHGSQGEVVDRLDLAGRGYNFLKADKKKMLTTRVNIDLKLHDISFPLIWKINQFSTSFFFSKNILQSYLAEKNEHVFMEYVDVIMPNLFKKIDVTLPIKM